MPGRTARRLKRLFRLKIFLPVVLAAAFLAFAFSLGNLPQAFGYIRRLPLSHVAVVFALASGYLVLKGLVFALLLRELHMGIDRPGLIHAYAIGEMTLPVPAGVYAQNYVLQRIHGLRFARSSAATTVMLMLELLAVLITVLLVPVPGWHWLRPTVIAILGTWLIGGTAYYKAHVLRGWAARWLSRSRIGRDVLDLSAGVSSLMQWRILVFGTLASFAYLLLASMSMLAVGRGIGIGGLTFMQAISIYFFSLGVILLVGSFTTKLGLMEVVGLTAAEAWGYSWTQGLAIFLGFRLVWMGSIWMITGLVAWVLRDQFRRRTPES